MADLVIDTHTAIWYFANSPEISVLATQTIDNAVANGESVILSAITLKKKSSSISAKPCGVWQSTVINAGSSSPTAERAMRNAMKMTVILIHKCARN